MTELPINQVVCGDCREILKTFSSESIHFCMFSPGYWGLRDYGVEGQIGLEPVYTLYIQHLVEVGREIKRVLRKDGSWYLNLGDTYAGSGCGKGNHRKEYSLSDPTLYADKPSPQLKASIPPKCKLLMPYRVALALIDDGWICRNDIIWHKPNAMPSSVKDRLTQTHEVIFHFVRSRKYYYNLDAIREPHKTNFGYFNLRVRDVKRGKFGTTAQEGKLRASEKEVEDYQYPEKIRPEGVAPSSGQRAGYPKKLVENIYQKLGKNPGDFWSITTKPFPDAHFAVYPEALCERPIKSSCPPNGIVLDPMCGSGTTLVVAKRLGRRFIGIDLNSSYCEMSRKRLAEVEWPLEAYSGSLHD